MVRSNKVVSGNGQEEPPFQASRVDPSMWGATGQGRKLSPQGGIESFHECDPTLCLIVSASLPVVDEILRGSPGAPYPCLQFNLNRDVL